MRILYFASVRRVMGVGEERIDLPGEVRTAGALLVWLRKRDSIHKAALSEPLCIAVDQEHVGEDSLVDGASEVAFFPPVTGG